MGFSLNSPLQKGRNWKCWKLTLQVNSSMCERQTLKDIMVHLPWPLPKVGSGAAIWSGQGVSLILLLQPLGPCADSCQPILKLASIQGMPKTQMMRLMSTKPEYMQRILVTHWWGNKFTDFLAAVFA